MNLSCKPFGHKRYLRITIWSTRILRFNYLVNEDHKGLEFGQLGSLRVTTWSIIWLFVIGKGTIRLIGTSEGKRLVNKDPLT